MKTLTIMASVFIPLTFVAGVYGMNFEHMPELHSRWGYLGIWGVMLGIALSLLAWFRKRGWLRALVTKEEAIEEETRTVERPRASRARSAFPG